MLSQCEDTASAPASGPSALAAYLRRFAFRHRRSGGAYAEPVLAQLTDSNAAITRRMDIQSLSEREVLACGDVLSAIVNKARDLTGDSERAVASSSARSEEITARFVLGMQEDIRAQEAAVQKTWTSPAASSRRSPPSTIWHFFPRCSRSTPKSKLPGSANRAMPSM